MEVVIGKLASPLLEQRTIAGRALGELVRKLGARALLVPADVGRGEPSPGADEAGRAQSRRRCGPKATGPLGRETHGGAQAQRRTARPVDSEPGAEKSPGGLCFKARTGSASKPGRAVPAIGDRILPEILPLLKDGLQSPNLERREGVCIGVSEVRMPLERRSSTL